MLLVICASLVAALLPAGIILDRRLSNELREKSRKDLEVATVLLADRDRTTAFMLAVQARGLAADSRLRDAVSRGRTPQARRILESRRDSLTADMLLFGPRGERWSGPPLPDSLVQATLRGGIVVRYRDTEEGLRRLTLAPIPAPAESASASLARGTSAAPAGAAGLTIDVGTAYAGALAGLTRSEVVILDREGAVAAASGDSIVARRLAANASAVPSDGEIHHIAADGRSWLVSTRDLDAAGRIVLARPAAEYLSVLPELRRGGAYAVIFALGVALLFGSLFARTLAEPVEGLALAASSLASGDGDVPLQRSRIREVDRVGLAFGDMREKLAAKMHELEEANRELASRQDRLKSLQAEMIRRDRLAASGRLVAELAHEIRNPVASVRNCLEIVRRKLGAEEREFADMAIDELLRMHELAEQMLDLNRPSHAGEPVCGPVSVAREVGELLRAGTDARWAVDIKHGPEATSRAWIPRDALKQVLLNLVENAREAMPEGGTIEIRVETDADVVTIEVLDTGPGIAEQVLGDIFDPFFTTKGDVRGVGLGLFIADGIIRRYGGSVSASNRDEGPGARFRIELQRARAGAPV